MAIDKETQEAELDTLHRWHQRLGIAFNWVNSQTEDHFDENLSENSEIALYAMTKGSEVDQPRDKQMIFLAPVSIVNSDTQEYILGVVALACSHSWWSEEQAMAFYRNHNPEMVETMQKWFDGCRKLIEEEKGEQQDGT